MERHGAMSALLLSTVLHTAPNCSQFIGINHRIKMGFVQAVMGSVNQCKGGLNASSKCLNMIKIQTFKIYIKKVNRKFKETSFQTAEGTSFEFLKNMFVHSERVKS
jgi:hypothetical protein